MDGMQAAIRQTKNNEYVFRLGERNWRIEQQTDKMKREKRQCSKYQYFRLSQPFQFEPHNLFFFFLLRLFIIVFFFIICSLIRSLIWFQFLVWLILTMWMCVCVCIMCHRWRTILLLFRWKFYFYFIFTTQGRTWFLWLFVALCFVFIYSFVVHGDSIHTHTPTYCSLQPITIWLWVCMRLNECEHLREKRNI